MHTLSPIEQPAAREFLVALNKVMGPLSDSELIQSEACRVLAQYLDVGRAYYADIDQHADIVNVAREFVRDSAPSLVGQHRLADFAWSLQFLLYGECHVVNNTQDAPVVPAPYRAAFAALQIMACISAPIIKDGRLDGALCVTDSRPRVWTPLDVWMVKELGERLWSTVARARAEEALRSRNSDLQRQTRQLRRLASELTLAEHNARKLLSKTLHDHLQQLLFGASLTLGAAMQRLPSVSLLEQTQRELKEAMAASRSLSFDIFPPALQLDGLPGAIEWLGPWASNKYHLKIEVTLDWRANPYREDARVLLFESVRELIFNVAKHAQAEAVTVSLSLELEDVVQIVVADDGAGFDTAAAVQEPTEILGLGLFSIRERLALLGGRFDLQSAPGCGTRATMSIPLHRGGTQANQAPVDSSLDLSPWPDSVPAVLDADTLVGARLRVLIVDDHALVRDGLRLAISANPELEVVGEAVDGADGIQQAYSLQPDVVVMDMSMPVLDGVAATKRLRAELPHIQIYGLSTHESSSGHPMLSARAHAYFSKRDGAGELVDRLLAEHAQRTKSNAISSLPAS